MAEKLSNIVLGEPYSVHQFERGVPRPLSRVLPSIVLFGGFAMSFQAPATGSGP
jgi:hypothetical protein